MMPGMDGFEVCRRLKAEPRMQHIPVIIVTALDQPADRVKGLEAEPTISSLSRSTTSR
jgi:two-component system cell cycle response regulator